MSNDTEITKEIMARHSEEYGLEYCMNFYNADQMPNKKLKQAFQKAKEALQEFERHLYND